MPHIYTDTMPNSPVKPLDPFLPLIDLQRFSIFTAHSEGKRMEGKVHPQFQNKDTTKHHPFLFYVEFPTGSGNFKEFSIRKLASIFAEGGTTNSDHIRAAKILNQASPDFDFQKLIQSCAP